MRYLSEIMDPDSVDFDDEDEPSETQIS